MEHQQILNLLIEANDSKFVTRKWDIVKDQSNANYDVGNEIIIMQKFEDLIFAFKTMPTF